MSDQRSYNGPGIAGLLGVAFVVLKLCGVINWSWLWVLCPFWAGLTLVALIAGLSLLVIVFFALVSAVWGKSRARRN